MRRDTVPHLTRPQLAAEAVRRNQEQLARLGVPGHLLPGHLLPRVRGALADVTPL